MKEWASDIADGDTYSMKILITIVTLGFNQLCHHSTALDTGGGVPLEMEK